MLFDVILHELPQHLGGGLVVRAAGDDERFAQLAVDPNPEASVFGLHGGEFI